MADAVRLHRTMDAIDNSLDRWVQTRWVTQTGCGTAYCFAGWAVHLEGIEICTDSSHHEWGEAHIHGDAVPPELSRRLNDYYGNDYYRQSGGTWSVPGVARVVLGLDYLQADSLFCATSTRDRLRRLVHVYGGGGGVDGRFQSAKV